MRETVHLLSDTADITGKVTKYFTILEIRMHFPLVLLEKAHKARGSGKFRVAAEKRS